jgi:uncharacterized protein (DUF697 family)/predicted GTPase
MTTQKSSFFQRTIDTISNEIPESWINLLTSDDVLNDDQEVTNRIAEAIPTIWLLGKTGAGKSSFVKELTQICDIEIGNGFVPCTKGIKEYHFPEEFPILNLLDTQGLGEVGYDSSADIEKLVNKSNIIVLIMKLDEPDQTEILETLKMAKMKGLHTPLLVLHSGASLIGEKDVERVVESRKVAIAEFWKEQTHHVEIDFKHSPEKIDQAFEVLSHVLPLIKMKLENSVRSTLEEEAFGKIQNSVFAYATMAGAVALIPAAGPTLVMVVQGKALASIADHYGLDWDKSLLASFLGAMGTGFVIQQLSMYGARTLLSAIPWVGSAVNATIALGSTYAFGRVFSYYMYQTRQNEAVTADELQKIYRSAFKSAKKSRE